MFTKETAHREGAKGGRAKARKKLTLERIERELPALTDYESAQQRLAIVSNWLAAGLMSGTQGHAFVRAHEAWLRAAESRLSAELVDDVTERLDGIEAKIKQQRTLGVVR